MSILAAGTRSYTEATYTSEDPIYLEDITTILVDGGDASVEIWICMDTPANIADVLYTETWYLYKTVAIGAFNFEALEYGPNAIKFKFTGTMKAWVKG